MINHLTGVTEMPLKLSSATAKDRRTAPAALPDLQHRHFAAIAHIIREMPVERDRRTMAQHFADKLAATNAKFDRTRFLCACIAE
jgi:hypothetical protein